MGLLDGKIIFITGASAGIGKACAQVCAREGATLIMCARREDKIKKMADSFKDLFKTASYYFQLDVRNSDEVHNTIAAISNEFKAIDVLVNNAGLSRGLNKLHEGSLQDWEEMIDTNVKGLLYVSREVIPGMVERKKGHIINVGSIAGHEVYPGGNVYCATKHAVDAITKGMQIDLVDTPVRVSTVDPGLVETEFSMVRFRGDKERAKKVYEDMTPLTGNDIAEAVLFCITRPPHVNIHQLRIMPTAQASSTIVHRA